MGTVDRRGSIGKPEALAALSALAHGTRLDIYCALAKARPYGMPAGAIRRLLDITAPTLSSHLNHLERAGLVARRCDGRLHRYSANRRRGYALIKYLVAKCQLGD